MCRSMTRPIMPAISLAMASTFTTLFLLTGHVFVFLLFILRRFFAGQAFHNSANALLQDISYPMCQFFAHTFFVFRTLIFALVIISMVPILAFYMFAQKKFIQGFAGGLKG